jgi:hypothetical protein
MLRVDPASILSLIDDARATGVCDLRGFRRLLHAIYFNEIENSPLPDRVPRDV